VLTLSGSSTEKDCRTRAGPGEWGRWTATTPCSTPSAARP
jgi:hypothetical protein